jgi:DNA-binding transcriptional regulator YiaG
MTQEQLARNLEVVVSTVSRWEQLRDAEIPLSGLLDLALKQLEAEKVKKK